MLSTQPLQPGSSVGAENAPPSEILPHLRPEVQQRPPGELQAKRRSCGAGTGEWGTGRGVRWPGGSPGWTLLPPSPLGPSTGQGRRVGGWATCRAGGRVFQLAVRLLPFPSATASPRPVACAHHLFLAGRGLVLRARARLRWGAVQACGDLPSTAAGGHEAGTQRLFPRGRSAATLSALRVLCGLEPPSPRLRQGWWHCLTPGRSDGDTQCTAHGSARTSLPVHRPARWPPGRGASSHMQGSPEPCRPRKLT